MKDVDKIIEALRGVSTNVGYQVNGEDILRFTGRWRTCGLYEEDASELLHYHYEGEGIEFEVIVERTIMLLPLRKVVWALSEDIQEVFMCESK